MSLDNIMAMTHTDLTAIRYLAKHIIGKSFDDDLRTFLLMAKRSGKTVEEQLQAIAETRRLIRSVT